MVFFIWLTMLKKLLTLLGSISRSGGAVSIARVTFSPMLSVSL